MYRLPHSRMLPPLPVPRIKRWATSTSRRSRRIWATEQAELVRDRAVYAAAAPGPWRNVVFSA